MTWSFAGEFEVVIMIEVVTEKMHGSNRVSDLKPITSEPWLVGQILQQERNGALFGVQGLVLSKAFDTADIVREEMFLNKLPKSSWPMSGDSI
jgi:hypothetical protein